MEGEEIQDIYECSSFVNDEDVPNKIHSVDIDPLDFPFSNDDVPF